MRQARPMGHQELLRQDRLHTWCRNLQWPGQIPPLFLLRLAGSVVHRLTGCGELVGGQQEPHAVHGSFLQPRRALQPAAVRTACPGSGQCHAKPHALSQGTWEEAN